MVQNLFRFRRRSEKKRFNLPDKHISPKDTYAKFTFLKVINYSMCLASGEGCPI
jgi:hypothetical protein